MSPSSLPRSTQASSQVYPPTTSRATGLGVVTAEQQLWGVDRGQTWVGVSICIHTVWGGAGVWGGGRSLQSYLRFCFRPYNFVG